MKTEEIISYFNLLIKPKNEAAENDNKEEVKTAYNTVINALEKQIPKKPTKMRVIKDFNGNYYTKRGTCPNCGHLDLYASNAFYCYECGQRLDWSFDENIKD